MRIDADRLLADLRALAEFGRCGSGVHRPFLSPEDRQSRHWLVERMRDAGLEAQIDGVGSVYGRCPGVGRALLIGSHTDTVPRGGWLDGALGVIYGLEIARARSEAGEPGPLGVDVISFADEESAFLELAGSRAFCGSLSDADIHGARNREGVQLAAALAEAGWAERPRARLDPSRHVAYLEAHIEQGPRLEAAGRRIGVVTSLVGIRRVQVTFSGQADHAGTTPMHLRRDAGAALIDFCHDLRARLDKAGEAESVWNLGRVSFEPGAANVVPAEAQVLIEYRDPSAAQLDRINAEIASAVAAADGRGAVRATTTPVAAVPPTQLDPALADVIASAAQGRGQLPLHMTSGAGHDAMTLSPHLPSAMLFVPSIGGRSHDVAEDTAEQDIILGAQVLADTAQELSDRGLPRRS
ncbi:MAG: hydantoinase/carbamoylase family amidase [Deltaproteobacteria bacterium]|nr:hydantoinase/carbamoylase family amidase [Deltaproteobacteria bacterium]